MFDFVELVSLVLLNLNHCDIWRWCLENFEIKYDATCWLFVDSALDQFSLYANINIKQR
jgi:hypothetical protein